MRRIKVLHITSTRYGIGGVERLILDMSSRYDRKAFDLSYCNLFCDAGGKGAFPTALREHGLKVFEIPGRTWNALPGMVLRLSKLIRREQIDVVHLHMLQATIVGGLAARLAGRVKVVVTRHYTDQLSQHPQTVKRSDAALTSRADRVIAISEYVKRDLIDTGVAAEKISVVYNGTVISSALPPSETKPVGQLFIGTIGSLTNRKGHEYLFEAFPTVLERFPSAHLLVVGEGPEQERLDRLRSASAAADRIEMLGFQQDVQPIMTKLDLYVHPSTHEPFGIAILEAMAASKCVIATAVEGVPEIVIDGETGILVEPREPGQLADAICQALEDPAARRKMGDSGRRRVEEVFNIETTVKRYEGIYRQLTGI